MTSGCLNLPPEIVIRCLEKHFIKSPYWHDRLRIGYVKSPYTFEKLDPQGETGSAFQSLSNVIILRN